MDELAVRTVADVRARHDGRRRNPFSEPECGHHYARAMASWGVLLAWTGQRYDAVAGELHLGRRPGLWPWCAAGAFGCWRLDGTALRLLALGGSLRLAAVLLDGRRIALDGERILQPGAPLTLVAP
mgnify:CR=1 FL=1